MNTITQCFGYVLILGSLVGAALGNFSVVSVIVLGLFGYGLYKGLR